MMGSGKKTSLSHTVSRWAGLVACAIYLVVASDVIYAFPAERVSTSIEVLKEDECANMVCAVRVNDAGKSTCCCNPDGEDSGSAAASTRYVLKDCSSPQDREGTVGSKTTQPDPQSAAAARLFVPAAPGTLDRSQTALRPPYTDIPDKIPI